MAFNIALSGLRAASVDLEVTGNNIANASTVGFKKSRVEFGDIYASGFLGSGNNSVGDGVRVQDVRQQFAQGNVSFTDNGLDMAINGQGFFILNNNGEVRYSRAGQFGLDKEGFIVNNQNMKVQGFIADQEGNLRGVRDDIRVDSSGLTPQATNVVLSQFNLDSRQPVLVQRGTTLDTSWAGALSENPAIDGIYAGRSIDVDATGIDRFPPQRWTLTYGNGRISSLNVPPIDPDNPPNALNYSAGDIANVLSAQDGVNASASTSVAIPLRPDLFDLRRGDVMRINGVPFTVNDANGDGSFLDDLIVSIGASSLVGFAASVNVYPPGSNDAAAERAIYINSNQGDNISIEYVPNESDPTGSFVMQGSVEARHDPISDANADDYRIDATRNRRLVTGELRFTFDDTIRSVQTAGFDPVTGNFGEPGTSTQILGDGSPVVFSRNTFNPNDQRTYNHTTSTTIYDSLGNPHVLTQYFVKNAAVSEGISQSNRWTLYVTIDGLDVGPPTGIDPNLNEPTRASYHLVFNDDGSLNQTLSDDVLVTNWLPRDGSGVPNGSIAPQNFEIDMSPTTQYGSPFAVDDLRQNGYTTGRITGLDVSSDGVVFARYSNGQSKVIAQVALATFRNPEGLAALGDTTWAETFESGNSIIGAANTGPLGSIKSSSVEESNVDLSAQLVNLIIAQRNFQANAKTIETADTLTQTIINLR